MGERGGKGECDDEERLRLSLLKRSLLENSLSEFPLFLSFSVPLYRPASIIPKPASNAMRHLKLMGIM